MGNATVRVTREESRPAKRLERMEGNFLRKVKGSYLRRMKKENGKWRSFKSKSLK